METDGTAAVVATAAWGTDGQPDGEAGESAGATIRACRRRRWDNGVGRGDGGTRGTGGRRVGRQ